MKSYALIKGKKKLWGKKLVVNSTVVAKTTILFSISLKGNKILSTFIEYVMCVSRCAKYIIYFNPTFWSTLSKVLFLFYKMRKLRIDWVSSPQGLTLLTGKKMQNFKNHYNISYHGHRNFQEILLHEYTVGWLLI